MTASSKAIRCRRARLQPITKVVIWLLSSLALTGADVVAPHPNFIKFGIAVEPYPPFEFRDASGKWSGFEIDLMEAVCAEMKAKCELVDTPWDGIIRALEVGKFDVIWASMTITESRAKVIDFTDRYYRLPPSSSA